MDKNKKDRNEKEETVSVSNSLAATSKNGLNEKKQSDSKNKKSQDLQEVNARKDQSKKKTGKNPSAEAMGDIDEDDDQLHNNRFNQHYDEDRHSVDSPYERREHNQDRWNDNSYQQNRNVRQPNQWDRDNHPANQWSSQNQQRYSNQHNFDPYQNNPYPNYQRRQEENQWNNTPSQQYSQFDRDEYNRRLDHNQNHFDQNQWERNHPQNDFNHYGNQRREYPSYERPYERNSRNINEYYPQSQYNRSQERPSYRDYEVWADRHNEYNRQHDFYDREHHSERDHREHPDYYVESDRGRRYDQGYDYHWNQGRNRHTDSKRFSKKSLSSRRGRH